MSEQSNERDRRARFVLIGGFLGSGKTTALARLARYLTDAGRRVGIITNDLASNLVDTGTFRSQGFAAEEIPGACFCGNIDALTEVVGRLSRAERPEFFLTEPVGSCTDLIKTVVEPLQAHYGGSCTVAPLTVLVDPARARKILGNDPLGGFTPKAAYLYRKQLEEAEHIAINKADTLTPSGCDQLVDLIRGLYPAADVFALSARTGAGFDRLLDSIERADPPLPRRAIEVDAELYAQAEAELAWFNGVAQLRSTEPFELDALLFELALRMSAALRAAGAEPAHLKMLLRGGGRSAVVNLVRGDADPELAHGSGGRAAAAELIVNARVQTNPELLRHTVEASLQAACAARGIAAQVVASEHFQPGQSRPAALVSLGLSLAARP